MKGLLLLGVTMVIVGLIVAPWAATTRVTDTIGGDELVRKTKVWEVSAIFDAQQRLIFSFQPDTMWSMYADYSEEFPIDSRVLPVVVAITDPQGGQTKMKAVYAEVGPSDVFPEISLFIIKTMSNDGGLIFEESNIEYFENGSFYMSAMSGITRYEGEYKAAVLQDESGGLPTPPTLVILMREGIRIRQPYWFITPVGVASIVAGCFVSIYASKKPRRRGRSRSS